MIEAAAASTVSAARPDGCVLSVGSLHAWYGESHVLYGIDFDVRQGEVVSLLGRNGAGKTTTLRSLMGMMARTSGSVMFRGKDIGGRAPEAIARQGMAICPEERGIFASLSVQENLLLPPVLRPGGMDLDEINGLFPFLKSRLSSQGTKLSGGEQQMLAIARILRTGADVILLDEPTEGLAPVIVEQIGALILRLKARGYTTILVEQNIRFASSVSDRHLVMENGRIVSELRGDEAPGDAALTKYLSV